MKAKELDNLEKFHREELDRESRRRSFLASLLDERLEKSRRIFSLKSKMGNSDSYIAVKPLSWVDENADYIAWLPVLENAEKIKKISANEGAADLHNTLDWRRQAAMTADLAKNEYCKFPPLLLVAYQSWAYKTPLESDIWGPDGRAMRSSIYVESLDSEGYFCDIADEDTRFYVLDGQHRLLAIRGLRELVEYGELPERGKDGKKRNKTALTIGEVGETREWLNARLSQKIGVEIIPAVQQWETAEEAAARLRRLLAGVQSKKP